jgi:catechol 2,3-dioxygenase-like lactoylglutathione lyase family enzyme
MSIPLEAVHPVLMSSDPSRSILFFARLGFTVTFQDRPASPRYVAITRDGVALHLQWQDESQWACAHDRPTYRFLVQDVDGLFETFQSADAIAPSNSAWAAPGDTPWGTREFHVLDPDGNGLQFYRPLAGHRVQRESARDT